MSTKPFLKYVGGKTQLLPHLIANAVFANHASYGGTYHEPFVGGGALFFTLKPKKAVLSDINSRLISTYLAIRDNVDTVICRLQDYANAYARDPSGTFHHAREIDIDEIGRYYGHAQVAAWMIFLNKTCFNGLYRVNKSGKFNVPMGKFKTPPKICDEENLRACSAALQGVEILCQDFRDTPTPKKGDFWYADPPYWPLSDTSSFTSYTAGGFDSDKQAALAAYAEELRTAGVHVLLSNSSASPVRALYESHGFTCHEVSARRSVNSDASKRAAIKELLIW